MITPLNKKAFSFLAVLLFSLSFCYSQIVTNTNNGGPGSFQEAIGNALGATGSRTITFNITSGTAPFIINTGQLNLGQGNLTNLTIDATTQPGWTAGQPVVVLRGNNSGICFNVFRSNLTVKGLIIQRFEIGYNQTAGTNNNIQGCWFGLDYNGTSASSISDSIGIRNYGVIVATNPGGNTLNLGSRTNFTSATRNIISGCGVGGVIFDGAGAGSYVGNCFIGTDKTGLKRLPNGGVTPMETERRHGITIGSTPNLTINRNVISANKSGGIDVFGSSSGLIITGNKIGTDSAGLKPLGNRTFGIRIKDSGGHMIGGTTAGERNIISANGSSDYEHEQRTINPLKFDWYNSCGIYLFNSGDNTVAGNYIGVDATGNRYTADPGQMGNFYVGIKIDGTSVNNKIGLPGAGNIIGQNGFRSTTAATAAGLTSLDGHGMIIKDKTTTNTLVVGNRIGVGANGTSKVGNKQDGISVQGSVNTTIGGTTAAERNIIGDNTWGIYVASNYFDSQTSGCIITGNFIGTNAAGTAAIGNGTRADHVTGGGIGVIHHTLGTIIGGSAPGAGNVVSGNRRGISILGNSPALTIGDAGKAVSESKLFGNIIGLSANGNAVIPNLENGIYLSEKAFDNEIGGSQVGQGNRIAGNIGSGIFSSDANSNFYVNNIIGNLTDTAKSNKGDGLTFIQSTDNIINGNTIANNRGNAISITDAASVRNAIHLNQISCNLLRGIELNGLGNDNFPKPTFSGTEAAMVVTGPVGSFIELYSLDACNNCSDLTSKKLQGRTLVASGASPLSFAGAAGATYTATASESNAATPHNTSEFSDCYSLCSSPNISLAVIGDTVCKGTNAIVTIRSAQNIQYQAFISSVQVATGTGSGSQDLKITIPIAQLTTGSNTVSFKAVPSGGTCTPRSLSNSARVIVNGGVDTDLSVIGDTVCQNQDAMVTIKAAQSITYQAYKGTVLIASGKGTQPQDVLIPILKGSLTAGGNLISFKGVETGRGCVPADLNNKALVIVNTTPKVNSDITTNSPICSGAQGTLTVVSAEAGKFYQVFDQNNVAVSDLTPSTAGGILKINLKTLTIGNHTLSVKASVPKCTGNFILVKTAPFVVNKGLNGTLTLSHNGPICLGGQAIVTIINSENGVEYQAFNEKDDLPVSSVVMGNGNDRIVNLNALTADTHIVYFKARIGGCGEVRLGNTATIIVNTDVKKDLSATATTPICLGATSVVTIKNSEPAKTYQVFKGATSVSSALRGNGGNLNLNVPSLPVGNHKFTIHVTVDGCKSDTLLQNPVTTVNTSPDSTLSVGSNGPVCGGNQALFYILKPEPGKKYQIFHNDDAVSQIVSGSGDPLKIPLNNLQLGVYVLAARATSDGCNNVTELNDKVSLLINRIGRKNLNATVNGPVCIGNPAVVSVDSAEAGKFYTVYYNGTKVSDAIPGNGSQLNIPVNTQTIPAGTHPISIGIAVAGCTPDTLTKRPLLTINDSPADSLQVNAVSSPICIGTGGAVKISGINPKTSYQAFIGADSVSLDLSGPGPDITLPIAAVKLSLGINTISVKATIAGCRSVTLLDNATIQVNANPNLDLAISVAPPVICEGGQTILSIATSEVGVSYQAVVGTRTVSEAVTGTGGKVELSVSTLDEGNNTIGVRASVGGCISKNLDSTVMVTVNKGATINYNVTGSTVCLGTGGEIRISGSEFGVSYEAFLKSGNTSISGKIPGTGNAIVIPLKPSTNAIDTVIVKAIVGGCGEVRLDNEGIIITNDKNASKLLSTRGSAICINDVNGTATILNATKNVTYHAIVGGTTLPPLVGNNADLVFTIPMANLSEGPNTVSFTATFQACEPVNLDSTAIVMVNNNLTSKDLNTKGSDICVNDQEGTATILLAKTGVSYQAQIGDTLLPQLLTGTGSDLVFTIPGAFINMGPNAVTFFASIDGCTPVELTNKAIISRNDNSTSKSLLVKGSTVCISDSSAPATILSAKTGVGYQAFLGATAVSDVFQGTGSDLVLNLRTRQLNSGINTITFLATVPGCLPVTLDSAATVILLGDRFDISGSDLRCYFTEGEYSIPAIPGIQSYNWTVPEDAVITKGQGENSISVKFGDKSGLVTVIPVGNIGACIGVTSELPVSVEPPFNDTISIIGKNLVCANDSDIVFADSLNVIGVDRIDWIWSSGIVMTDTLNKTSVFKKFGVTYPTPGFHIIKARPHIRCSDTFGVTDSLMVQVLAYPIAEAGTYELIDNDITNPVALNGTGSSVNGVPPADSLTYQWRSEDRNIQITNPNILSGASLIPADSETKIYLTVSNRNKCSATDSAIIGVGISIQIPNIFTPNNDGSHDKWEIKNLHKLYPNCTVEVFNKWGSFIYRSNGYAEAWDGTRNGEEMPVATYYYIVDFKDGNKPSVGSVTIIR